jgi:hypothetical protein
MMAVRMFLNYFAVEIVFGVKDHYGKNADEAIREISHVLRHGMLGNGHSLTPQSGSGGDGRVKGEE